MAIQNEEPLLSASDVRLSLGLVKVFIQYFVHEVEVL